MIDKLFHKIIVLIASVIHQKMEVYTRVYTSDLRADRNDFLFNSARISSCTINVDSTTSSDNFARFLVTKFPAAEKILSDGALVAGTQRYFLAKMASSG